MEKILRPTYRDHDGTSTSVGERAEGFWNGWQGEHSTVYVDWITCWIFAFSAASFSNAPRDSKTQSITSASLKTLSWMYCSIREHRHSRNFVAKWVKFRYFTTSHRREGKAITCRCEHRSKKQMPPIDIVFVYRNPTWWHTDDAMGSCFSKDKSVCYVDEEAGGGISTKEDDRRWAHRSFSKLSASMK